MATRRNYPPYLIGSETAIVYRLIGLRESDAEYEWEFGIIYVRESEIFDGNLIQE